MFLEVAAVIGALIGAISIAFVSKTFLAVVFSLVLFLSAYLTIRRREDLETYQDSHPWAKKLQLDSTYPLNKAFVSYRVQNVPLAFSIMGIAGMISGLLGVGSGTLKVLAMDQALRLPYKVATTTSNFMIGITAAVSAGIYIADGYINPSIAFPVMLGVIAGSFTGAKVLPNLQTRTLRVIFSLAICIIGIQMLYKAMTGTV